MSLRRTVEHASEGRYTEFAGAFYIELVNEFALLVGYAMIFTIFMAPNNPNGNDGYVIGSRYHGKNLPTEQDMNISKIRLNASAASATSLSTRKIFS